MEKWFARRRKSKVLELADRQITLAMDTVDDLKTAVLAAAENKRAVAETSISHLSRIEHEIDKLRRTIFEELTQDTMSPQDREDIMHLVKRLDEMADHVKDAARALELVVDTHVPKPFWAPLAFMATKLVEVTRILRRAIEKLRSPDCQLESMISDSIKTISYKSEIPKTRPKSATYMQPDFGLCRIKKEVDNGKANLPGLGTTQMIEETWCSPKRNPNQERNDAERVRLILIVRLNFEYLTNIMIILFY